MMTILKNILKFITDPKNTRMILLGGAVILLLLFLHQCNATKAAKAEVERQKQEAIRISNNYEAAVDTIRKIKINDNTWRSEKLGYEITIEELGGKYASLLGDFKLEKNKPPKTIIKTEFIIKDSFNNVPVFIGIDRLGKPFIGFNDSTYHDSVNYRFLGGEIPYKLVFNSVDSLYKLVPGDGRFNLVIGMNLNLGLFQDKKTKKISILADTNYPGVTFTTLEGASIMDDPANKKILRSMRKPWSLGLSVGYGAMVNVKSGGITTGPYVGIGINYSPRFLQWGK